MLRKQFLIMNRNRERLGKRNMRDRDLVKRATRTNIEEAFKPLVTTLSKIAEEDP